MSTSFLISTAARLSGNFDFRVFIVFFRSASDPRGVDACRVFPSYAP